jgi:hypothetical protein
VHFRVLRAHPDSGQNIVLYQVESDFEYRMAMAEIPPGIVTVCKPFI